MSYNRAALFNRIIQLGLIDDYISFAAFLWHEKGYSLFNSALIYLQRPGALYVDTEEGWSRMRRSIRPEATPIVVIHPFGPVNFLYELEDTYGDYVPYRLRSEFGYENPNPLDESLYDKARSLLNNLGIYYNESTFGTRLSGEAVRMPEPMTINVFRDKKLVELNTRYAILVKETLSKSDKVLTIFHEIGHILCGHIRDDGNKDLKVPDRRGDHLTLAAMEFEAEKVCEFFFRVLGYEYDPSYYLAQFAGDCDEREYSIRYVMESVDKLIAAWLTC